MLFLPNLGPFIVAMIISDWITVKTAVLMASKKAAPAAKTSVTATLLKPTIRIENTI
jgi:hypothetical protein